MLKPKVRQEAASWVVERFGLSQRRAGSLVSVSRTVFTYTPRENELNDSLRNRIKELAGKYRRYGHWRLYVILRREGFRVNHKRTERIYRSERLSLRIRKKKKLASMARVATPEVVHANQIWAMDFVSDSLWTGRKFRSLTLVDTYTKESLAIEVDTSLSGQRVVRVLERLSEINGLPEFIRVDNGPEFISKALDEWAYRNQVKLDFIRPGKPTENAYIESFNGKFRDECLNENYFSDLTEAREVIERWRVEYNTYRPHSSLNDLTPEVFRKSKESLTQNHQELYL